MCGKYIYTSCKHGMPEWPLSATCIVILVQNDCIGIPYRGECSNIDMHVTSTP